MEYRVLGPLEVIDAGSRLAIGGPRHRRLLAVLLLNANTVVSSDRLIEALWGEHAPGSAQRMVHVRVSELRAALRGAPGDRDAGIVTRGSGYQLRMYAEQLDARRFERLATAGREALTRGDHAGADARLREALALWRGPPFDDIADESFARPEITRLEGLQLQVLEARAEVELALGRHGDAAVLLAGLVAEHPLHERFWFQLMLAQYRADRQGEALHTYLVVRELMVDQLGSEPSMALQRLHDSILHQDPALDLPHPRGGESPVPEHNLPERLTSFVGRAWDIAEIEALLRAGRLVTVVGVGGAGKSRLAVEAARRSLMHYPDGVWLVDLASLTQPGLVINLVAATLRVREHPERPLIDVLAEHLANRSSLLLLDNCEHLLDEVAELAQRLLWACPRLSILATTRERLGITGETLKPLSGLAFHDPGVRGASERETTDAARLLVDRAGAVRPGFRLDDDNAGAIALICEQLDGLPLAIELAAARVSALDVEQVAARLNNRFRLLDRGDRTAAPRHQTLRAVVEWSYGLLDDAERRVFNRAAVFVGGFTLEAAEAVCPQADEEQGAVASALWRLVDKSLVVSEGLPGARRRFRLLETLRAYGLERLFECEEADDLRDRHAEHFLAVVAPASAALRGPDQSEWLNRLELEHGNLRAAMEWSLQRGAAETAVRLVGSLYPFWDLHGHYSEGRRWLARALAAEGPVAPTARARALMGSATLAVIQGDLEHSIAACEEAAELSRQAGDHAGLAHALQYLGLTAIFADDLVNAPLLLDESLANARIASDAWLEGWALLFLATASLARGALDEAVELSRTCERVSRAAGDPECVGWALLIGALANFTVQDHVGASAAALSESLEVFRELGAPWGLSLVLFACGLYAGTRGDRERLTVLMGASEALRVTIGAALVPFIETWLVITIEAARSALGDYAFERAWREGQVLPLDTALRYAAQELEPGTAHTLP